MKIKERVNAKETRFKIKRTYLGWLFIAISIGLVVAGGVYYVQAMG